MATCGSRFAATQPALLLVMAVFMLATACAPGAHALIGVFSIANLTIVNSLSASLVATLPATYIGSEKSVTVAPGKKGVLQTTLTDSFLPSIFFTYEDTKYSASGNVGARVKVLTNTLSIYVSTPCVNGQSPGLQANYTTAHNFSLGSIEPLKPQQIYSECALPTSAA
ncbi:hypothetical protein M758_10G161300 [Ceratodon purpureus]|nr:hypothetical protein M758_10G161300 [Ceratodon purpureus]